MHAEKVDCSPRGVNSACGVAVAFSLLAPAWPPEAPRVPVPGPGLLSQWLDARLGRVFHRPPPPRVTARDRILQQWGFCHPETHPRIFSAVSRDPQMHALLCLPPRALLGGFPGTPKGPLLHDAAGPALPHCGHHFRCCSAPGQPCLTGGPSPGGPVAIRRPFLRGLSASPREESSPIRSPASGP